MHKEKRSPQTGGCWICGEGNGFEDDDMAFDMEFDTFYHPECLPEQHDTLLEYEKNTEKDNVIVNE